MSSFKVGQKVVCVDDTNWAVIPSHIKKGDICTIESTPQCVNGIGLVLVEDQRKCQLYSFQRVAYSPARFRPLLGEDATQHLLESIVEVTETSDSTIKPVKQPQTA